MNILKNHYFTSRDMFSKRRNQKTIQKTKTKKLYTHTTFEGEKIIVFQSHIITIYRSIILLNGRISRPTVNSCRRYDLAWKTQTATTTIRPFPKKGYAALLFSNGMTFLLTVVRYDRFFPKGFRRGDGAYTVT